MLKVCLILPKGLPVPNVKGGAIESLVTDLINQNEIEKKLDITVYSIYNEKAEELSKKYEMTKCKYIKNNLKYKFKALYVRLLNLFGNKFNTYNELILDEIKYENFDYIMVEDGAFFSFESYLKYYRKDQMILHFHHNGISDKRTDNTFSTFIGVSDFVVNTFKQSSSIKDCYSLKNGINLNKFNKELSSKERNNIRKKIGLNKDDFVVMFCGRLIKEKGVLELVKAIKQIENENIKLMIVGSINFGNIATSEYQDALNNEINSSNGKVVATGFVNYSEIYKYYKTADIAVIPSLWEDAAPLVNIETMACGLPNIITKTGGAPEYISKETIVISKENVIENIKENVINLYNDSKKREKMTKAGLKTSKEFSTENFYNNFVSVFIKKEKYYE